MNKASQCSGQVHDVVLSHFCTVHILCHIGSCNCHALVNDFIFCFLFLGQACRDKVRRYLKVNFQNISDAEEAYNINYFQDDELFKTQQDVTSTGILQPSTR